MLDAVEHLCCGQMRGFLSVCMYLHVGDSCRGAFSVLPGTCLRLPHPLQRSFLPLCLIAAHQHKRVCTLYTQQTSDDSQKYQAKVRSDRLWPEPY